MVSTEQRGGGEPAPRTGGSGFGFGLLAGLGGLLLVAAAVGLVYAAVATITGMEWYGCLLLVGGVVGLAQAVSARKDTAFWLLVAVAALNIAAGVILLTRPDVPAIALTLFVSLLLLGAGLFRVVGGLAAMSARLFWTIVVGAADLAMGALVLAEWPTTGRDAIGTYISLALLVDGLCMLVLGLTGRRIVSMVRNAEQQPADAGPDDRAAEWQAGPPQGKAAGRRSRLRRRPPPDLPD